MTEAVLLRNAQKLTQMHMSVLLLLTLSYLLLEDFQHHSAGHREALLQSPTSDFTV